MGKDHGKLSSLVMFHTKLNVYLSCFEGWNPKAKSPYLGIQNFVQKRICLHASFLVGLVGFLKLNHHYVIQFSITDDLGEDISADPLQNLHCRVTSCVPTDDGNLFICCLYFSFL